jgi:hypothetical protein
MLALLDRLMDFLFGRAYRKLGPKRYELRLEIRGLLQEAARLIDPPDHAHDRPQRFRQTLDGLGDRVELLPERDKIKVLAAMEALQSVKGGAPSLHEYQATKDAWKATADPRVRLLLKPSSIWTTNSASSSVAL